jgi:glycosyltransferase involved in cell wall biosynthesis
MKIVIVCDSWADGNGAIVATKRMMKELEARGHEFTIVTTNTAGYEGDLREVPGFYLPGVKESMQKMDFQFGKGKTKILKDAFKDADLVTIQFPFFLARKSVSVAKKMGIPVMAGCHMQPQNFTGAAGTESELGDKIVAKVFKAFIFGRVDAIHIPSRFGAELYQGFGINAHFRVVSNGIPREYVPMEKERPEFFGDKFTILNVGRHALEKRQELLIDGVLHSKYKDNIQLLLCGKGEDTEKLRKRGEELPVKPFIEYISMEDKLTYLNTADMYVQSSVIELESLSCLEAIGCGLPCLISNAKHSAAPQFALDDRFLFAEDDAESLGKQIDYWYENREELKKKKADALEMAEKYRMDKCVGEMERLYEEVAATKNDTEKILEPGLVMGS